MIIGLLFYMRLATVDSSLSGAYFYAATDGAT